MNNRIKKAFDVIHAEEELKEKTKAFLFQKAQGKSERKTGKLHRLVPALICLLFVLIGSGGCGLYFIPTAAVSIDINPSLELEVNRFDQVVAVKGYNDDGYTLASSMHLTFQNYNEAVKQILENEQIAALLSQNEVLTITVTGSNEEQRGKILSDIELCTAGQENAYCYSATPSELAAAHEAGLSYGKYRAFLELQAADPNVTPEDVQGMTMREIRDLIAGLSSGRQETNTGNGTHGTGNGGGRGNGMNGMGRGRHGQ
ncbi:MAG TPA: hypothetical protein IAC74_08040 [Candidatus Aphodoplasma excrementigallinarum]|uniref:Anti-sigma factor RsgI-like middle domain-containing protein n=1 Tax=Candidatus Aphodoplasma excrementigallinarum TaxID=2840673 RepID=A0A9D1NJ57_9FIRM|nr:hypothetical protein [Candidatus Aphodoplasma excrementigallinarum]